KLHDRASGFLRGLDRVSGHEHSNLFTTDGHRSDVPVVDLRIGTVGSAERPGREAGAHSSHCEGRRSPETVLDQRNGWDPSHEWAALDDPVSRYLHHVAARG